MKNNTDPRHIRMMSIELTEQHKKMLSKLIKKYKDIDDLDEQTLKEMLLRELVDIEGHLIEPGHDVVYVNKHGFLAKGIVNSIASEHINTDRSLIKIKGVAIPVSSLQVLILNK